MSLGLTWGFIRLMQKVQLGQYIRQYGPDIHMHKQGTPTMGGVVFGVGVLWLLPWMPAAGASFWFVLAAALLFGAIGLLDDLLKFARRESLGLKARYKFLLQAWGTTGLFLLLPDGAHVFVFPGTSTTFQLEGAWLWLWLYLVSSGTTHAFNLTDGLDGLAAGVGLIALVTLGVVAGWQGHTDLVTVCVVLGGLLLGFLMFNRHPARVFMGDTGAFVIGGSVAALAFAMGLELYLFLFALVPVLETLSVALQLSYYHFTQRRIFKIAPLHHHFEATRGVDYAYLLPKVEWPEARITLGFWLVAALGALVGLGLYSAP